MKNKIISLVLALAVVFSAFAFSSVVASAAGTSLSVSKLSEDANTVKVAIGISGNTGMTGLGATLNYDGSMLELQSVDSAGITSAAGMPVFEGGHGDGTVSITVINNNAGTGTKDNGTVCIATFKKLSPAKNGTSTNISVSADADMTFDGEENPLTVSGGSADIKFTATSTTKPATSKPSSTKAPAKPSQKPVANNGSIPTTLEETTTEEFTTEELTLDPNDVTEYASYEYEEVEKEDDEDEDEDKSQMIKRIIAIAVIVICVGAVVVLLLTRKKS